MNNFENPQPENEIQETTPQESSFGDILQAFEESHAAVQTGQSVQGRVVAVHENHVLVDIGQKSEGVLSKDQLEGVAIPEIGQELTVTISGRNEEGALTLALNKVVVPKDWSAIEKAFAEETPVNGTVTGQVKGGLTVDIGVRAFMPASRSGTRDVSDLHTLLGKEIRCKIIKLDTEKEDVVVDRRAVLEAELKASRDEAFQRVEVGAMVEGVVRSVMDYGAFVDVGGVDGLLHVTEMAYGKVGHPSEVVKVGETVTVKVIKKEAKHNRISLSLKQTLADPWTAVAERLTKGARITGKVVRLADFGAFVEIEPGIEGLIHLSEMTWSKKARKPSDLLTVGESVEAVVLEVKSGQKRIALGLKQALGDPWKEVVTKYPVGAVVEGSVTNLAKFGAFVELEEGVEGMIHIADLASEHRIEHPQEVIKVGETVRAQVLSVELDKQRIRLGTRQLLPTPADEFIKDHKVGDSVSGRVVEVKGQRAKVEIAERVTARCALPGPKEGDAPKQEAAKTSITDLSAMLAAKWKEGGSSISERKQGGVRVGQIARFKIVALDPEKKAIDLEYVSG
ncbi:MAG: 30S ribosomal protein S1 [Bryobacterales bacterium]|nr:30S ribosomal protein S1 [Bryobacterales bacterium]